MRCRSGLETRLNHFVSCERAIKLIATAPAGALLAFDEALHFGDRLVPSWCKAASRGAEILIASPSMSQVEALERRGHSATRLRLLCQRCGYRYAARFFLYLEDNRTESVCDDCYARLQGDAEKEIVGLLKGGNPRPGEDWLIQPIDLPQCSGWNVIREDCPRSLQRIIDVCAAVGLPGAHSTYLDFGCRTGFFCHGMAAAGFNATGIDPSPEDIKVARLLSTYCRHDAAAYHLLDVQEFLRAGLERSFDVITVFGISAWITWRDDPRQGFECLRKLFRTTGRICAVESVAGNSAGADGTARTQLDRAVLLNLMNTEGGFARIDQIERTKYNLRHDLIVGYKHQPEPTNVPCSRA